MVSSVIVRLNIESISSVIDDRSSCRSGVSERLVVHAVDVFKPESMVAAAVITLGIDGHGDERRRICLIDGFSWLITGLDRDRFKHRQGKNDEVEVNNS